MKILARLLLLLLVSETWAETKPVSVVLGTVVGRMAYDREILEIAPGARVKLILTNTDHMQHNWVLCRPGKDTAMAVAKLAWALGSEAISRNYVPDSVDVLVASAIVNPGEQGTVEFTAPDEPGAYPYVCTLPGHAMTMKGVLYVGVEAPKQKVFTKADFPASGFERAKQLKRSDLRYQDSGVLFSGTLSIPGSESPPVYKGIALRLGDHGEGGMVFDPDLMRMAAGWLGRFIELTTREDEKVENRHRLGAAPVFENAFAPGVAHPLEGHYDDRRKRGLGPLPKAWAHYRGLYLSGKRAVLRYTVGDREVLESPWLENVRGHQIFTRMMEFGPSAVETRLRVCPSESDLFVRVRGAALMDGEVRVSASPDPQRVKIYLTSIVAEQMRPMVESWIETNLQDDLHAWMKGGPTRWEAEITTVGDLAEEANASYVVDTLTLPYDNPWNGLMYPSGHDFLANGDAVISMAHGDVWTVSGIDECLGELRWKRFATGLSSPLGLKVFANQVYVICHDQLTRLHDLNGDGEADFYENFNNAIQVTDMHHRFTNDLECDSEGNFYFLKCTDEGNSDHGGSVLRVSADGDDFEVYATGLRNPNGLGIGPKNQITFGKQQGGWIPSSAIHLVERGGYYGYQPSHHRQAAPTDFEKPLCWIPHGVDNSSADQAWAPVGDSRWGPLSGNLLHFSYGKCSMFVVPHEVVDGVSQGGVVPLRGVSFRSSAMRSRFRANDGQLYVSGLRGWQTSAELCGAFHRVRYTGKPLAMMTGFSVEKEGVRLGFSQTLDRLRASDPGRYQMRQWSYRWTKGYGSKDYSIVNPEEEGRDIVAISAAVVSADGRSVLLTIENLRPIMQCQIQAELQTAEGREMPLEFYGTVNVVPKSSN